jgi:CBS domain-containing protein
MNRAVCAVGPDDDIAEAAGRMMRAGVHRLLVLDGPRLLGIVTATDIVRAVADHRLTPRPERGRHAAAAG